MKANDLIRLSLENSTGWCMGLIQDMQNAPLQQPTANGGNHPLWILGHLAYGESFLLDGFIIGQENRFADWESLFAPKSTPSSNLDDYPSFEELMGKFQGVRAATLEKLDSIGESDLDAKTGAPEEYGAFFGTVGACFAAMSTHIAFHAGQVADCRRAAGRDPLMM